MRAGGSAATQLCRKDTYAEAEPLYNKRSLALLEKVVGIEHPNVASSLNNLAGLYQDQGRYAEAEPLLKRSLALREKSLGPEHPNVASSLNNLAGLYQDQGRYAEAEPLYLKALAIFEKALGPEHPHVATSLNNLASLYGPQGRYAAAEPLLKKSLALREMSLGPEHPHVADSLNNLAWLYRDQKQQELEQPLRRRVQRIDAARLRQGLPGKQGVGMTDQRNHALGYLQLLVRLERPDAEDRANALAAVQLTRRAESGEAFRLFAQRLAAGGSGELAGLVRQRQELIQQLEALGKRVLDSYGSPTAERPEGLVEGLRTQIEVLERQETAISERLQREFPNYAEFEGSRLADLASLQQVLRPGEAALAWVLGEERATC